MEGKLNQLVEQKYLYIGFVATVLVILPWVLNEYWVHVFVASFYYMLLALSWGFLAGKVGIFSLGIHALAGLSAYTSALSITYFQLPLYMSMPLGVATAVALSFMLAATTLKMRGIYLALTTWAFAEISRIAISVEYEITRGDLGLQTQTLFGLRFLTPYYYLFAGVVIGTVIFLYWLSRSRIGYLVWACGQDPILSSSIGIDVYKWRVVATMISGIIAGVAGVLFGHYVGVLAPSILGFQEMATVIMMVIVGGYGTLLGPVIGALLMETLMEGFRIYREWRLVIFAVAVILIMRFYREGVVKVLQKYTQLKIF
jgi:branched-chain amino acid transport system permease protein